MQQRMSGQGDQLIGQLIRREPPGLKECRAKMATVLEEVCALAKVPPSKVSQSFLLTVTLNVIVTVTVTATLIYYR